MSVDVSTIGTVAGVIAVLVGGFWGLVKILMAQFNRSLDERFKAIEERRQAGQTAWNTRIETMEKKTAELDKDVRQILIELPREYVSRTDYVRRETIIEAKIDKLSVEMRNWILEAKHGG